MALSAAGGEIGQNSLEMIPFEDQEYDDYCTGEILVSAVKARTDYQCMSGSSPESFLSLSPVIAQEVSNSVQLAQQNNASMASINQTTVDAASSPVITDDQIQDAPDAVSLGSANALGPFTPGQLSAARRDPVNWPGSLTIQGSMQRSMQMRRNQALARRRGTSAAGTAGGLQPTPAWGTPCASGGCGLGTKPWGSKLLLFTGLGLIGVGLLHRK